MKVRLIQAFEEACRSRIEDQYKKKNKYMQTTNRLQANQALRSLIIGIFNTDEVTKFVYLRYQLNSTNDKTQINRLYMVNILRTDKTFKVTCQFEET